MNIIERQAKIPSELRNPTLIITASLFVVAIFFDFLGIGTLLKWVLIVLGVAGVGVGGYFVYLRTKDG